MEILTNKDANRRYALNDKAVKAVRSAAEVLQEAAASGMYMLMQGHAEFINDLYRKLAAETGSPKDAEALRSMYAKRVIDLFGKGGVKHPTEKDTWIKRPVPFFKFGKMNKPGEPDVFGFSLVDVKNNKALSESDIKHIKEARKEIRDKGEAALNFQWKNADAEQRDAEAFGIEAIIRQATSLLTRVAKSANVNGFTKNQIAALGRGFNLPSDKLSKVLDGFNDGTVKSDEKPEEEFTLLTQEQADAIKDGDAEETGLETPMPEAAKDNQPEETATAH